MTRKPPTTPDRAAKEPTFEETLTQLESIIERIEGGKVGLEGAIAEYERGVGLLRRLRDTLRRSEQRVEELNRELEALDKSGSEGVPRETDDGEPSGW